MLYKINMDANKKEKGKKEMKSLEGKKVEVKVKMYENGVIASGTFKVLTVDNEDKGKVTISMVDEQNNLYQIIPGGMFVGCLGDGLGDTREIKEIA